MDGIHVNTTDTPGLKALASLVRKLAIQAGYDLDKTNSGAVGRLAAAAGMSQSSMSKFLAGTRMPEAKYFAGLARAISTPDREVDPVDLFIEADILKARSGSQSPSHAVASPSITPDAVADSWGVDEFGRQMVHAMFERLTRPPQSNDDATPGSSAAGG